MLRLGVMVSGGGTNLQAILDKMENGYLKNCEVAVVVSSKKDVYALERAARNGIPSCVISKKQFSSINEYDQALVDCFREHHIDVVVLAGFLSMLGPGIINAYRNRIINIHPSLIPSFCGKGMYGIIPHQKAIEYGVKVTGATVHFVDLEYDSGPIIMQKAVNVRDDDTPESLQKRVMEEAEWQILPEAIRLYEEGKLKIEGRKVHIG